MEENACIFTLEIQLDSCMDSLLKRTTAEITALVKDKFAQTQNGVLSGETEHCRSSAHLNISERQSEKSDAEKTPVIFRESETSVRQSDTETLMEFQSQLNSCVDGLLKQTMVEIIAWVKECALQFHNKIAAKEAEIKQLTERLHILETQTQITLKAVRFGSSGDQPSESPVVYEEIEQIDSDAVVLDQDKGVALVRNVPEAACFVEAEPSLDYELTVATTATEGVPHSAQCDAPSEDREEVVLEVSHTYPETWGDEGVDGSPPPSGTDSTDPPAPFQQALEQLGGAQADVAPAHICPQCWKSFSKEWILRRHMRRHGDGSAPSPPDHDCPHCGRGFKHRKGLASHLRSHSGEKPYACEACGQRFTRPESAKKHGRLHSGVKPYGCPQCPRRFFRSDGLKSHMRTHDGSRRPGPSARPPPPKLCMCSHCGKAYANATQVADHERTHTGERPYECAQCHKRFRHSGALSVHRITHQRERPHACPACPKSFRCAKHLKRHLLTHSEARPFSCDRCPLSFRTTNELKAHTTRHGLQRTHACPDCGKSFKTEYEVKLHRRAHSGERPYPCSDCDRTFRRLHHLSSHRLTHTGERPHACSLCPRRFIRAREMRNHKRKVHLAIEVPFRCAPCQVSFDSLSLLEAHRRTLHGLAESEKKLLEGLQRFPRILPRQAGLGQGGVANPGAQQGELVNQGAQRGGRVLGPVVFLLAAGQGVPVPVVTSAAVMTPVTTVVKVPIIPMSRAAVKLQRRAPVGEPVVNAARVPTAKVARKTRKRKLPASSPPGTPKKAGARAPLKGGAKADTKSLAKQPSSPPLPSAQMATATSAPAKVGPKVSTGSSANDTAACATRSSSSKPPASPGAGSLETFSSGAETLRTAAHTPVTEKPVA